MWTRRRIRGSVTSLGAALAIAILVLGIGFLFLTLYLGGSTEIKNAVDAGALNVGKEAIDNVYVSISQDSPFYDVTNDGDPSLLKCDGKVNLRRLNRVWAKALLIAANADAAEKDVYATNDGNDPSGMGNSAQSALDQAQKISDDLANKLNQYPNPEMEGFFSQYAQANSLRMLGLGSKVAPSKDGWDSSTTDREMESNIVINKANFPPQWSKEGSKTYKLPSGYTLGTTRVEGGAKAPDGSPYLFLKGYTPLTVGNRTFWQVPFQYDQKPHAISKSIFDKDNFDTNPLQGWENPVPNAFAVKGQAQGNAAGELAMSWVLSNPRQIFPMSAPHSFIKVHLDEMKCHYYFFPPIPNAPSIKDQDPNNPPEEEDLSAAEKAINTANDAINFIDGLGWEFGSPDTYGYTITQVPGTTMPFGGILAMSVTCASTPVGQEVVGRPLDNIIFDVPPMGTPSQLNDYIPKKLQMSPIKSSPGTKLIELYMVNRINQMLSKPGLTLTNDDLHSALGGGSKPTPEGLATIGELIAGDDSGQDYYIYCTDGKHIRVMNKTGAQSDPEAPWMSQLVDKEPDGGSEAKIVKDDNCMGAYFSWDTTAVPAPYCVQIVAAHWNTWHKDIAWTPGSGLNGCLGKIRVKRWTNTYALGICVY